VTGGALTEEPAPVGGAEDRLRRIMEGVIGVPATQGNQIDVLRNGDQIFPAMLDAIDAAEHTVDLLTFVYWAGSIGSEVAHRLSAAARRGVRVRVLLDSFGARSIEQALLADMDDAGVVVRWFRPLRWVRPGQLDHRTHRKVMIVDESIGFTGGVGIADEWLGDARDEREWRDTHFRVVGPAVDGLRAAFLDNWTETDDCLLDVEVDRFPPQPQPGTAVVQCVRGAAEVGLSDIATMYRALLQIAERSVRITTAYFVPDEQLLVRLCDAADRGVRVEVLLPGPHADKRFAQLGSEAVYHRLLEHGVEIWNFQPSMLHAKVMTVDGVLADIGSANFNGRSVRCDEEINLVVLDRGLVDVLDRHFDEDLARSEPIDLARWARRSVRQRIVERVVSPIRPVC
jgi:cardiolipin synthase